MLRQNDPNKKKEADQYLNKAFQALPALKARFAADFPTEKTTTINIETTPKPAITEAAVTGVEAYIQKLKESRAAGGAETSMNSVGRDILYAVEYFDGNNFDSAEMGFRLAVGKDANNTYANYLLAVSLAAQGKSSEAKIYLQKAVTGDALLTTRYNNDVIRASEAWQKIVKAKEIKTTPAEKIPFGGKLVFGNYTCHQTIYNGPNATPAFSNQYKGYFVLRANGTYRWLDDGGEGKYSYDSSTGKVTWLSGHLAGQKAQLTTYKISSGYGQITINFNDNYRWECGCKIQ
jgi:Flp pilus assembly protein TadD